MRVEQNLAAIRQKINEAAIRVERDPNDVTIIAVTKNVTSDRTRETLQAGIINLAENRAEALMEKWDILGNEPVWHLIGTLQKRKVKQIIDKVSFIHSLDRLSLAQEIQARAHSVIECFVQVNVSGEESKHGLVPEEVISFINELEKYDKIKISGLMTMAPLTEDTSQIRDCFKKLKEIQATIINLSLPHAPCKELSMGMSGDYEIAVEEGATMVRIGTALVGED